MLSVTSLRNAIHQQLADAESKRKLAESLMKQAEDHATRGDYARAQLDRNSAERYLRDLKGIENTIAGYEAEIMRRELKAKDIDKRINDLEQHFKHDAEQLEKEKGIGVGGTLIGSPLEAELLRRQLKNKGIDSKIVDLQKHYRHDIEQLENEKHSLLD